jgi:hypothetical protein
MCFKKTGNFCSKVPPAHAKQVYGPRIRTQRWEELPSLWPQVDLTAVDVSGVDVSGSRASFHVTTLLGDKGTCSKVLILV